MVVKSLDAIESLRHRGAVYDRLGVRPIINANGTQTTLGGSIMEPEVAQAMADSHCAKYAKFARRVQMGIERAGPILGLRKKISTLECVQKGAEGQGPGSTAKGTQ